MTRRPSKNGTRRAAGGTITTPGAGDLDDVAVFVEVARRHSFAEASRRLAIPTSSVSRAIARLERAIGVPLLRRTSRSVALTPEGEQLLDEAGGHVARIREALAQVSDRQAEATGVVRVTAPAFTGATRVADALAAFALAHPRIAIELDASNAIRDLLHDGYDFGIRVGPNADADFTARKLWQGRVALYASRDFVQRTLRDDRHVSRAVLERVPCVVLRTPIAWRFVNEDGAVAEVAPTPRFVINDPRSAVEVACRGLGLVLAPVDMVSARGRELVRLTCELGEPRPVDLFIVYPARRFLAARVRLAIDWLLKSP